MRFIICLFSFSLLFAAERVPTISVLKFTDNNQGAASQSYGNVVAVMFGTHLRNETNFVVLEPGSAQKAGVLLTGEVSVVGSFIQIDAKLISAGSGEVVVAEFAQVGSQAELRSAVSKLAKTIEDKYLRQWMGGLQITVLPTEGEVYLNEQFVGKSSMEKPLRLDNLLEGKHALRVLAGGYQKQEQNVQIQPRTVQNIQVSLQSLPGSLSVESEPSQATIIINGKTMGTTPYKLDTIAQGSYNIELQAENFKTFYKSVKIQSGQLSELKAVMEVIPGQLLVQSVPTAARVFLGTDFMGNTPLLLENIKPGTTNITVKLNGYSDYKEDVQILPGKKIELNAGMSRQTGKLTIVSGQHGLSVQVNGETQMSFEAPFHKQTLNAGEYQITISKPKYYDAVHLISIKPDSEFRLETELALKPGRISFVNAGDTPTDVFINEEYKGKASGMSLELPQGEHTIILRNWFNEKQWKIQVQADKTEEISLEEFVRNSSFSWWGAIGAVLIAIPIYFAGVK